MRETQSSDIKKKGPTAILLQIIIAVTVLVLIWFSFGQNVMSPRNQDGIPEKLGDLELVDSVKGAQAVEQLERLHRSDIELVEAYIANYAGTGGQVRIWIGTTRDSAGAKELTRRMISGIEDGNASFRNLRQINIPGIYLSHTVYQVDGPGGDHFFYISPKADDMVVWLSVEEGEPLSILEDVLNTF